MVYLEMDETRRGSPNGRDVRRYVEGERYNVPDSLANVFLDEGWAHEVEEETDDEEEEVVEDAKDPTSEDKSVEPSENKEQEGGWDMSMSPHEYLDRWPEGPHADRAKRTLGIEEDEEE